MSGETQHLLQIFSPPGFLFISNMPFFSFYARFRGWLVAAYLQRSGGNSADKTSFLPFLPPNCLRSVQTIQGQEKLFDL
jgi:hypothetical protein